MFGAVMTDVDCYSTHTRDVPHAMSYSRIYNYRKPVGTLISAGRIGP